jgi:threonine/homoserine/homoserine lactone efflux protein
MNEPAFGPLWAPAAAIAVAAITPGPNNIVVMRTAARVGVAGAAAAIAGIVLGSLSLLLIVFGGLTPLLSSVPAARAILSAVTGLYLCWLGWAMVMPHRAAPSSAPAPTHERSSARLAQMAFLQFVNPKSWALVLAACTSVDPSTGAVQQLATIGALLVSIPVVCLSFWSVLGASMTKLLSRPLAGRCFDVVMGLLLIASGVAQVGAL